MSLEDKPVLAAQPFLRGLPDHHLTALALLCRHVAVPSGRRLLDEDETPAHFWLIDAGQVVLDTTVPGRGRLVIQTLGRGDIVGLNWLLPPPNLRRFGAVATQPMQAFEFDARAVRAAFDDDPCLGYELSRRVFGLLVRRLAALHDRLIDAVARPGIMPGITP
jgi:CRP/FNR family transcriptional regulator, cyclic AMP receptor protein